MANHPSAQKRARQNLKRRERNRHVKTTVRSFVKKVRDAVVTGDTKGAKDALLVATKRIDQAVVKGVFHRRTGSRYISRLAQQVAAIKGGAPAPEKKTEKKAPAKAAKKPAAKATKAA